MTTVRQRLCAAGLRLAAETAATAAAVQMPRRCWPGRIIPIGAKPGDRVVVQSASSQVLGAAVVVYLLPLLLLLGGYGLARGVGAAVGFALGLLLAVWMDRRRARKGRLLYTVSSFAEDPREEP